MDDESRFYEALREFHGPEKFSELRGISIFGKSIDLYRFYQCAKKRGGPTDAIIMTQWREICLELGMVHPSDFLTVKDAHKASKFFCDCFNGFVYPNPDPPNLTRFGRKTKKTLLPNLCDLDYRNADNLKGRRAPISEDNLIWMAMNVMCTPKYKFFSNRSSDPISEEVSTFDDQWILPSNDKSVCLPYKIRSKVACAAKLATELTKSPGDYFLWGSHKRDDMLDENLESPEHNTKNPSQQEMIRNVIHEVAKFLMTGHDLEICLTILLKALMVVSLPQVPGLCKYLAQINLQLSEELHRVDDLKKQKEVMHVLDILCNILTLVVRDFFLKFSKNKHKLPSFYHQVILCIDSIRRTSCILLSKIETSFRNVLFRYNSFTIDTRTSSELFEDSYARFYQEGRSPAPGRRLYDKIKYKNHLVDDEDADKRRKDNYKINHLEIVSNFLLLIKYLTKTSTEHWQCLLLCIYIEPFLKFLLKMLMGKKIPDYWFWDDFQDCMRLFFSSVLELCKKMGQKMQIATVVNIYILCVILMHDRKLSKTIFRKMTQIIFHIHRNFNLHELDYMKYIISKACQILTYTLISMPSSRLDPNQMTRNANANTQFYDPNSHLLELIKPQKTEDQKPLYSEELLETFAKSVREKRDLKKTPANVYLSPDNPMCNPWCALPWDRPMIRMAKKKKTQNTEGQNKTQRRHRHCSAEQLEQEILNYNNYNPNTNPNYNPNNGNGSRDSNNNHNNNDFDYNDYSNYYYSPEENYNGDKYDDFRFDTQYNNETFINRVTDHPSSRNGPRDMFCYDNDNYNSINSQKSTSDYNGGEGNYNRNTSINTSDCYNNGLRDNNRNNENENDYNHNLISNTDSIETNATKFQDNTPNYDKDSTASETEDEMRKMEEGFDELEDKDKEYSSASSTCSSDSSEDSLEMNASTNDEFNPYDFEFYSPDLCNEIELLQNVNDREYREKETGKGKLKGKGKGKGKSTNPFYSETVHVSEKFTMEEAVAYLQQFYKVVFRINEKKSLFSKELRCTDPVSMDTPTNDQQSLYEEFNYRPPIIDLESDREIRYNGQQVVNPENIRVKIEPDDDQNSSSSSNYNPNSNNGNGSSNYNNNNHNRNYHNTNHNNCNNNSIRNNNTSNNNGNNNRNNNNNNNEDTHYYEDDQDRSDFPPVPAALIDYDFLNYTKLSKTTKEIICMCLVEMINLDFCLDIIRTSYYEILECAYSDESAKPLWPIIHKIQMESSIMEPHEELNREFSFPNNQHVEHIL